MISTFSFGLIAAYFATDVKFVDVSVIFSVQLPLLVREKYVKTDQYRTHSTATGSAFG